MADTAEAHGGRLMDRRVREARLIRRNIRGYRRLHAQYEEVRGEIFNPIEQRRLRAALERALGEVSSDATRPLALDFGCGSGNLTRHLGELGAEVVAADVSPEFLRMVSERFPDVPTRQLNGRDLAEIPDAAFDFVGAYSVLHHIPDYLTAVRELIRVLRPGGVLYIDHEAAPHFWDGDPVHDALLGEVGEPPAPPPSWRRILTRQFYRRQLEKVRRRAAPRYVEEGDIHVWPDDHVEWAQVEAVVEAGGCRVVHRDDYLVYRDQYPLEVWERYRSRCSDMRAMVARKS